ncbi:MAG: hypothetical protein RLZZ436_2755 [Planctomycetota bacterium]|jgi:hypothetical protein
MKTRFKLSDLGKVRLRAYVGACAAWAASDYHAVAEEIHGYFDPDKNSVIVNGESPTIFDIGGAGNFNFTIDPRGTPEERVNSGFVVATNFDLGGGFIASDLRFATSGASINLGYSNLLSGPYIGAALVRYEEGDLIDGDAILNGTSDYTAGYLFEFPASNSPSPNGNFTTSAVDGYIGFAFTKDSQTHSGWIFVEAIDGDYKNYQILDWYYGTADVYAGDGRPPLQPLESVPEPSSLGLLAAGAAGMLRYRRRRKPQAAEVEVQPAA